MNLLLELTRGDGRKLGFRIPGALFWPGALLIAAVPAEVLLLRALLLQGRRRWRSLRLLPAVFRFLGALRGLEVEVADGERKVRVAVR